MSLQYRTRTPYLLVILLLMLASCRTFDVRSDWDDSVDFDRLTRFSLVDPPEVDGANPFADNTLLRKRIRRATRSVLGDAGYVEAATRTEADFVVTYQVLVDERLRVNGITSTVGTDLHRRRLGVGSAVSSTSVSGYQESTLLIDVLDPGSNELLWRGWGTGIVRTRDRNRGEERLTEGVRAIFRAFPPTSKAP